MVGKQQIQITGDQLASGLSTADNLSDGFVGTGSVNINPFVAQGEIYATPTSNKTGLSHALVASCDDWFPVSGGSPSTAYRWMVDTAGELYKTVSGGTITDIFSIGATASAGITDMAAFQDDSGNAALYVSRADDVMQVTNSGSYSGTPAWWSSTKGKGSLTSNPTAVHALLVYQNSMWIADGFHLHQYDSAGVATTNVLTLDPRDSIMALGVDPATGLMLISVQVRSRTSAILPTRNYIGLWDGYSSKLRRKVPIPGTITAFHSVGGKVAVAMNNSIGLWNGYGIDFLRRLTSTSTVTKHQMCVINNVLFVADGRYVYAFGDVINGKKAWTSLYHDGSAAVNIIYPQDYNVLALNSNTSSVKLINFMDTTLGAGTGTLVTNNINFPRPIFIRRVRVFTSGITTTAGIGAVGVIDENAVTNTPSVSTFVVASGTKYVFDFDFNSLKLQTMQPTLTLDTQVFSIRKIIVYYDVAE